MVSIIIVDYNGYEDTVECIESLKKCVYDNYNIIVVINGNSKDKLKNYPIKVEIHENGVFVNIDKSLEDIDIDDKYEVREVLDNILIKGYCDHDVIQFMGFLGKVPIYEEEILIVEILENETRKDLYNKYFIITKNKEVEYLSLDSDKFKIHKLK